MSLDDAMIPRGAPVSIDAECDRPFTARAGAVDLPIVDGVLDTVALGVGDHVVEVACDGTPVLEVDISVVEPVAGQSSAPATATTLLLFTCVGGFVVMGSPGSVAGDIRFRRSGVNKGGSDEEQCVRCRSGERSGGG
ncbi:MAG: hypothetical protein R2710_13875 [Acidimicrobiales bacterium]